MKKIIQFFKNLIKSMPVIWREGSDALYRDPISKAYNLRHFREEGRKEIKRAKRYGHPVAVALIDIDKFSEINNKRGHEGGDRVLQSLADLLQKESRESDIIARRSDHSDEFLVLMPETRMKGTKGFIAKINEKLSEDKELNGVSLSYGIAFRAFQKSNTPIQKKDYLHLLNELLSQADKRMYRHKQKKGLRSRT